MDKILILDFGSQTTQLIGRRIRDLGVFTEIVAGDVSYEDVDIEGVRGFVFSGSPFSVYEDDSPQPDPQFFQAGVPILGICYGFHQIVKMQGGSVLGKPTREYGRAGVKIVSSSPLFGGVPDSFVSWMSHGDSVEALPESFRTVGTSGAFIAAAEAPGERLFGLQFHPEVTHCEFGTRILQNFAREICGAQASWSVEAYLERESEVVRRRVGHRPVLLLISGGVDSSVVGALLLRALDPSQVHLMYVDTGLMRLNETAEVERALRRLGAKHLHIIDAEKAFLTALSGVEDPEEKRRIIGDLFMQIQEEEIRKLNIGSAILAQGTLYTDLIESGKGVGRKAHVIKSHHNVRSPLVERKRERGDLIEPLDKLYKDEVRELGLVLGLDSAIVGRHPFPGPGLAVRILGDVTKERCDTLREADAIFIEELRARGLYDEIWQAFCVLLPIRSVGVAGDARRYGHVLALRAIVSTDAMTADVYPFNPDDLLEISARITNSVDGIGRVVYDVSSKPPATIEWE